MILLFMEEPVERKSLAVKVADRIAAAIATGTWQQQLPGVRTLAARYGVNPKTCTAAMHVLEQRGVIESADQGRRRTILPAAKRSEKPASQEMKRLLFLAIADEFESKKDQQLVDGTREIWENTMGEVVVASVNFLRNRNPGRVLDNLIASHRADALVLHMPGMAWSVAAHLRLPTFQFGGGYAKDGPLSLSGCNHLQEFERMVRYLAGFGHRRILIPVDVQGGRSRANAIRSLRAGLGDQPPEIGTWEDYCPEFREALPEVWPSYWERAFRHLQPTAVIVTEDPHLLSLYCWCAAQRLSIPQDLSVIAFSHSKQLEWCLPKPAMMRFPLKKSLGHFKAWIAGGMLPLGAKILPLDLVEGDSVARAPGPARAPHG